METWKLWKKGNICSHKLTIKHQHGFANLKNNNCFCSTKANTYKDKLIKVFVVTCYKNSSCFRNGAKKNHKKVAISKEFVLVFVEVFVV